MLKKTGFFLMLLSLVLAALACVPPWNPEETPLPESTSTSTDEPEPDIPTPTNTPTNTPEPEPELPVFSNPTIFWLEMFTPVEGWAVTQDGNHLLRTIDGGITWLDATPPGLDPGSYTTLGISPEYLDANTVWVTPNSEPPANLYHTQDGGITWQVSPIPFESARYEFLDLNTGYAMVSLGAGAGSHYYAIYRTTDGGSSWTEVFSHEPGESKSLPEGGYKNGITFLDVNHGWIGGGIPMTDNLYLYYTEDGGATWAKETDISIDAMFAGFMFEVWQPVFVTDTIGYLPVRAMAPEGWANVLFYKSVDAGQTWTYQNFADDVRDFSLISNTEAWAVGQMNLIFGTDSLSSWYVPSSSGIPSTEYFIKVDFVDEMHGWVLTTPDDSTRDPIKLYRTTDGGLTWTLLP